MLHCELDSDEYWAWVEAVNANPYGYLGADGIYVRPMFEVMQLDHEACEYEIEEFGDCVCAMD